MAKDTVTIGCKLPAGIKLEIGLQTTVKDDASGRPLTSVIRTEAYESVIIRGWNHHSIDMRKQLALSKSGAGVPHGMNTQPFLNRNVPKAFWEQWKKEHPRSWLINNDILFEVASGDEAGAALRISEAEKTPAIFMPIDSSKTIVPGIVQLERE